MSFILLKNKGNEHQLQDTYVIDCVYRSQMFRVNIFFVCVLNGPIK